ncbi:hypothetical protein HDU84_007831 [Entophlyctis sp. JEL0112]|nr:hypothetical protein HDU84_007831 [Entophlyctis sp. JEL0112]
MSSSSPPPSSPPPADPDELTALDVLDRDAALVRAAARTLSAPVDNCSRVRLRPHAQEVYSCLDCCFPALVCYACFVRCHTRHDAVHLGVRRNFLCQCVAIPDSKCELAARCSDSAQHLSHSNSFDKDVFLGLFCFCKTKYKDDDEPADSFMLQCCLCENWFHDRCIKDCPDENSVGEFICKNCVAANLFLWLYSDQSVSEKFEFIVDSPSQENNSAEKTKIEQQAPAATATATPPVLLTPSRTKRPGEDTPLSNGKLSAKRRSLCLTPRANVVTTPAPAMKTANVVDAAKQGSPLESCKLSRSIASFESEPSSTAKSANLFCFDDWKTDLCRCSACMSHYEAAGLIHLVEKSESDDAEEPEADADAGKSLFEMGMKALDKLPRMKALDGVYAYERMAAFSKEYLRRFAEEGRVVTKEDIEEMFEELKRATEKDGVGVPL